MAVYVAQMSEQDQKEIKVKLEKAIREMGIYDSEEEIQQSVQDGLDSKLHELSETIDISKYEKKY